MSIERDTSDLRAPEERNVYSKPQGGDKWQLAV